MFINSGNAFDEAIYQYGLVKGVAFASQLHAKGTKKFLNDRVEQFIDSIVDEIAIASSLNEAVAIIYSQAENAWDNYRNGVYNGLKSVIDSETYLWIKN